MTVDLDCRKKNFQQRVKEIAEQEWRFFCQGQKKEGEYGYYQRVGDYWREGVGIGDRGGRDTQHRWSAAFISWVMRKAGAGDRFQYNSRHSVYIQDVIRQRENNNHSAAFKGYKITEVPSFSLQETDYMARLRDNLHKEQHQEIRGLALQIAELMAHRKRAGQSSLGRHEGGIARKVQDITESPFKAIDRGISYGQVVTSLKTRLQSLINKRTQARKKFKPKR